MDTGFHVVQAGRTESHHVAEDGLESLMFHQEVSVRVMILCLSPPINLYVI